MGLTGIKYENINFNSILREGLHYPKTRNGTTLYTHMASFDNNALDGDYYDKKAESDPIYIEQSKQTYNSPTNIRSIFITGTKIYVRYYTGPVIKNKSNETYVARSIEKYNNNKNLFEIAKDIMYNEQKIAAFKAEKEVNPKAELKLYSANNTGGTNNLLKALSCGWVASNIEEFYFDWTALLPNEVFSVIFPSICRTSELISMFVNNQNGNKLIESKKLKELIIRFNNGGVKNFNLRFPRLRQVAMISNLDNLLTDATKIMLGAPSSYGDNYTENKQTWFSRNQEVIRHYGGIVLYCTFEGLLEDYKTKENVYLFDNERLKGYFERNKAKLKDSRRKFMLSQNGEGTVENDLNVEIGPVESKLIQLEKELPPDVFKGILRVSTTGMTVNELTEVFKVFSKANRDKYKGIINLK